MKLVVIDHISPLHAGDIASLLEESGFDVRYDNLPRVSLPGHCIAPTTTPIYVPKEQAGDAQRVLSAYYAESEKRMQERISQLPPWWKGFGKFKKPAWLAFIPGLVIAVLFQHPALFLAGWVVGFIVLLQAASCLNQDEV